MVYEIKTEKNMGVGHGGASYESSMRDKPKIKESFQWLTPKIRSVVPVGKNKVRIRGVAAESNVVSKNKRKYLEKELMKSVNSLIGQPITINHDPKRIVGNVELAEWEDGKLEYVGIVNKKPYAQFLREGNPCIKGVSMDANYISMTCLHCGEHFFNEPEFKKHMKETHAITDGINAPYGIIHKGLSLVVAPEVPGIDSAYAELAETLGPQKETGLLRLAEAIMKNIQLTEKVVQRDGKWCVVHCHGDEEGETIKCFDTEAEAQSFHASLKSKETEEEGLTEPVQADLEPEIPCGEGYTLNPVTGKCEPTAGIVDNLAEIIMALKERSPEQAARFAKSFKQSMKHKYQSMILAERDTKNVAAEVHAALKLHEIQNNERFGTLEEQLKKRPEQGVVSDMQERQNSLEERITKIEEQEPKLTETDSTNLTEMAKDIQTLKDNQRAMIKGKFQGKNKSVEKKGEDSSHSKDYDYMRATAGAR